MDLVIASFCIESLYSADHRKSSLSGLIQDSSLTSSGFKVWEIGFDEAAYK